MQSVDQAWEAMKHEFEDACKQKVRAAACQVTKDLNQSVRRLRLYKTEAEWGFALLDACGPFAGQMALFTLRDGALTLRAERGLNAPVDLTFPFGEGAAFKAAIETKDAVVALRTASELTQHLSSALTGERAHLIPILNADRVVAVLVCAHDGEVDVNALELIAGMASAVLERGSNAALHTQIEAPITTRIKAPIMSGNVPAKEGISTSSRDRPPWISLSADQRIFHIRAQRFSRVAIAEIQLARPEVCRAGREQGNLYLFLKREIDTLRETYQKQFMSQPSMVDYLHLELVRVAASGDEEKLGVEYPGPLV